MLCLDVAAGALLSGYFAAKMLDVLLPGVYWLVLPLSVWVIYTADHLVDASRLREDAHTRRHLFIYRYKKVFFGLTGVLMLLNLGLAAWFLDRTVLVFGLVIGGLALVYFLFLQRTGAARNKWLGKELAVAVMYTAGLWGVPLLYAEIAILQDNWFIPAGFFMLVLADVLLLSYYERETDTLDGHATLAVAFGNPLARQVILVLCLGAFGLAVLLFLHAAPIMQFAGIILGSMTLMIQAMILFEPVFRRHEIYRYLAELVFWLPGLIYFIG